MSQGPVITASPTTPEGTSPAAMTLTDVAFGYTPDRPVVHELSATLATASLTALIGPNASGKSTLLRLMMGQLAPDAGRIRLGGHDVGRTSPGARARHLSYVPQRGSCGFAFTVSQVVAMGRHAMSAAPGLTAWALRRCDLDDLADRYVAELSVGQQQRVLLARALAQAADTDPAQGNTAPDHAMDPLHTGRVMLLDEPVSAMDPRHVHQTMRLLHERTRRGLAALVVLHDLNLAARYADAVWLLHEGRLAAAGAWERVLTASMLEPVYDVRFENLAADGERPLFRIEPLDRL